MSRFGSWTCTLTAGLAFCTASCSWLSSKQEGPTTQTVYHEIDEHATVIPATYGKQYTLSGNMVARFQDFDLALVKVVTVPAEAATHALPEGTHYYYEARNREGFLLATFTLGPQSKDEESTVKISRYRYHFSKGHTPGSIIIHLPYSHMAASPKPFSITHHKHT